MGVVEYVLVGREMGHVLAGVGPCRGRSGAQEHAFKQRLEGRDGRALRSRLKGGGSEHLP